MAKDVIISPPDAANRATVIKLPAGVDDGPYVKEGKQVIISPGAGEPGTYYSKPVARIEFADIIATLDGTYNDE